MSETLKPYHHPIDSLVRTCATRSLFRSRDERCAAVAELRRRLKNGEVPSYEKAVKDAARLIRTF